MDRDREWDLIILRSCCQVLHVHPDDDVCPDIETIANGDGDILEKVERLGNGIEENARAKRQAA